MILRPGELKTTPYKHQLEAYLRSRDLAYFGLLFEQRCGKTKPTLDTAAHQFRTGRITTLLVIAPNGVHTNWVREEIPRHLPDDVRGRAVLWRSGRMDTRAARVDLTALLDHDGLAILAVNVDALTTPKLREYLTNLFKVRKTVMSVVDESLDISNRSAERTKIALKIARRSVTRRVLDGTPVDATPLGLYAQCEFLLPSQPKTKLRAAVPNALGFTSFVAFRARYAELEIQDFGERDKRCPVCGGGVIAPVTGCVRCRGTGFIGRNQVAVVKNYQNLDELRERLTKFTMRVTRADCADLPPKIYQKAFIELTSMQRLAYEELREEAMTELRSGTTVTAPLVITRLLRLQQIASNFLPLEPEPTPCPSCGGDGCDTCEHLGFTYVGKRGWETVDPAREPRVEAVLDQLDRLSGQGIVWARFRRDLDVLERAIMDRGWSVVRYDGSVSPEGRERAKTAFQGGRARVFLGQPRAAGRGLDLSAASFVIYASHDWPLRWRRQSEDRAQTLHRTDPVLYVDVVAMGTVDEKIINALRAGRELADLVTGDTAAEWI